MCSWRNHDEIWRQKAEGALRKSFVSRSIELPGRDKKWCNTVQDTSMADPGINEPGGIGSHAGGISTLGGALPQATGGNKAKPEAKSAAAEEKSKMSKEDILEPRGHQSNAPGGTEDSSRKLLGEEDISVEASIDGGAHSGYAIHSGLPIHQRTKTMEGYNG
ncbi:hypothetical protein R1sor_020512 [Riccia sorocarpa]|uniref:Uncharacterized protein n=1 Tax=Riccia sorocarpa TaxID=122646 RepID=A0ABD3IJ94_9MARC